MRVLHLEDCPEEADAVKAILMVEWPECDIRTVGDRESFERALLCEPYDLIISDYSLPGYDGMSALRFAHAECPARPFIFFSGSIGEERALHALRAGATDYIAKDRPGRLIPAIRAAREKVQREMQSMQVEELVREQASLLERAREAIISTDALLRVSFWNSSAVRIYGWTAEEAKGRNVRELLYGEDRVRFDGAYTQLMETGEWRGQLQPRTKSGEAITVESSWSVLLDAHGGVKSCLFIDTDITERLKQEAQIQSAQRLETIGLLAGGIAHDLNNVLAPILTAVDLLRDRVLHAEDRTTLDMLEKSAQHGVDLVRQLLSFARGREGERVDMAIEPVIDSIHRLLHRSMPAAVRIVTRTASNLPHVNADATQLRQVLLNLCINARDALPEGGTIEVRAENALVDSKLIQPIRGQARDGFYVRVSVADNGTGIPDEIAAKIFDPFFTTKQVGKGTGLGLSNVAGIIKTHDGFITLDTELGRGTTFHLFLPAVARPKTSPVMSQPRVEIQGKGERLMVVEDDKAIRAVLDVILHTRGYYVTIASDGEEALRLYRESKEGFDLVLTDLNMPKVSGIELIRELRAMPSCPRIIAMSGLPDYNGDQTLREVEFLSKPLTAETLLGAVRKVLAAGRASL